MVNSVSVKSVEPPGAEPTTGHGGCMETSDPLGLGFQVVVSCHGVLEIGFGSLARAIFQPQKMKNCYVISSKYLQGDCLFISTYMLRKLRL